MKIYHSSPGSRRVMIRAFICLVALVIALAIIAPFVIPRIDRNTRLINSHRIDAILQDMRNLDVVLNDYRADHGGRYPESLRELENNGWCRPGRGDASYQWFYDPEASAARPIAICYIDTGKNRNVIWLTANGRIYQGRVFIWPMREHTGIK